MQVYKLSQLNFLVYIISLINKVILNNWANSSLYRNKYRLKTKSDDAGAEYFYNNGAHG